MVQLRDYQERAIADVYAAWGRGKRVLLQLPTGGGKTVIFSEIARQHLEMGQRVLIVAHRDALIRQAASKLQAASDYSVGIIKAGDRLSPNCPCQVASIQSLASRIKTVGTDFGLIIIDEAHHATASSYQLLFECSPDARILGVTATPERADGRGFEDLFDELVTGPEVKPLIQMGYLSRYRYYVSERLMQTKGAKKTGGDYNTADLARLNDAKELAGDLVSSYRQYADGRRCIVFAINVAHSQAIASRYQAAGIPAAHLDGYSGLDEIRRVLSRLESGEIQVVSNCNLFDEGLDIPQIEAVQLARPTSSIVKFLQSIGRALRPAPGKDHAIILDHTTNWQQFGLPDARRSWRLEGRDKAAVRKAANVVRKPTGEVVEQEVFESSDVRLVQISEYEASRIMLDRDWREILRRVEPISTRELFRQMGRLVSFNAGIAIVEMPSLPTYRLGIDRADALRRVMAAHWQQPVTVQIKVAQKEAIAS